MKLTESVNSWGVPQEKRKSIERKAEKKNESYEAYAILEDVESSVRKIFENLEEVSGLENIEIEEKGSLPGKVVFDVTLKAGDLSHLISELDTEMETISDLFSSDFENAIKNNLNESVRRTVFSVDEIYIRKSPMNETELKDSVFEIEVILAFGHGDFNANVVGRAVIDAVKYVR